MNKEDIKIGMVVDYHSIVGGPVTRTNCHVSTLPTKLGFDTWVCWLKEKEGCVSIDALSLPGGKP